MHDFSTPNLDAVREDDLRELTSVYRLLAAYAETKVWAMEERGKGRILTAANLERDCDRLYDYLPAFARW